MCGIVGIFDLNGPGPIDRELLHRMNESQFHRGPDAGGLHLEPGVGLGHRRLSIIDLSSGQQPLFNEDGSVVVTFNGEIYNFPELSDELKAAGHIFKTHSDTEVIVHAWEQWGEECVKRFRGMFAFAVWDRNRKTLFLARDRLGKKPFYYAVLPDGKFIFGSELKSLLVHRNLERQIDPHAVEDYFALGYVPEPKCIFKSVHKIPPAHTLLLTVGKSVGQPKEYWDIVFEPTIHGSEADLQAELIERLREAVNVRLMSEVPLGAFLSGGVDSSAIVAMMAQLNPNAPVNTCSIGFGDPKYNETEFAQMVADRYHTNHYIEQVNPDDFDLFDKLASLYDEPFADSSAIPTYRVCELAKKRVTVALSGDGGDENFAGYRRHRWHMNEERIRGLLPAPLRRPVFGLLGAAYPKMDWAPKVLRAKSTFQALAKESFAAYLHSMSVVVDGHRSKMFSQGFRSQLGGYHALEVFRHHAERAPTHDPLSLIQYIDIKTYLPGDILVKVDRASMAHALEVRVPILDHQFMEWVAKLAPSMKLHGQEGKYIFKKSLEPHLPSDVLYRPKMGFGVPISAWFRGPLKQRVRDAVLSETLADTGMFEQKFLKQLVDEHQSGIGEHSAALWSLLMFESFLRNVAR
jgi:asparagine synthase (glutamine-hydrolysing)